MRRLWWCWSSLRLFARLDDAPRVALATDITFTTGVPMVQIDEDCGFVSFASGVCSLQLTTAHGPLAAVSTKKPAKAKSFLMFVSCSLRLTKKGRLEPLWKQTGEQFAGGTQIQPFIQRFLCARPVFGVNKS